MKKYLKGFNLRDYCLFVIRINIALEKLAAEGVIVTKEDISWY